MNEEIYHKINPSPSSWSVFFFLFYLVVAVDVSRISVARRSGIDIIQNPSNNTFSFFSLIQNARCFEFFFSTLFSPFYEENETLYFQWTRAHWLIRTSDLFNVNVRFEEKKGGKRYAFIHKKTRITRFFYFVLLLDSHLNGYKD